VKLITERNKQRKTLTVLTVAYLTTSDKSIRWYPSTSNGAEWINLGLLWHILVYDWAVFCRVFCR